MDDPVRFASGSRSGVLRVVGWKMNLLNDNVAMVAMHIYAQRIKDMPGVLKPRDRRLALERDARQAIEDAKVFVEIRVKQQEPEEPTERGGR